MSEEMDDSKKSNIVKLHEVDDNCYRISPIDILKEVMEKGIYESADSLLIVGVKNNGNEFDIINKSQSRLTNVEIIALCEIIKKEAMHQLLGD